MPSRKPHVGDIAHHRDGLDPRPVDRVEKINGRWWVGLDIGGTKAWPCLAANYTFTAPPK